MINHRVSKLILFAALLAGMTGIVSIAGAVPSPGDPHSAAYLGVMVDNVSPMTASALHLKDGSGAVISGVDQDGPACHAGLKTGDIVTTFNGKPVEGSEQFASLIHSSAAGAVVSMTVIRDGQSIDMKVTLGDWRQMAGMPRPPTAPVGSMRFAAPPPPLPPRMYPDVEVPNFTLLSVRNGIAVEPLGPQLCDFFGVPQNKGVLVRSVEKGSAGAAAGLKAGDVILRVNNETVHDISDWRRAMKARSGKVSLAIVRDKREQTVEMNLPANTSKLQGEDWDSFNLDMQAMSDEMQKIGPEFAKNVQGMTTQALLNQSEFDEINRQAQVAAKNAVPDMKKQAAELSKQAAELSKQSEQMRKEMEKMAPQMARDAVQMADSMKPTAEELSDMARDIAKQMKAMAPEFQRQMEQERREWQDIFKGTDSQHF